MFHKDKVAFIGAGSMAEAIMSGILTNGLLKSNQIWVTNRSNRGKLQNMKNNYKVNISADKETVLKDATIIILAVKPKDARDSLKTIANFIDEKAIIVSVLAGIPIHYIAKQLPFANAIVRAMPNTSATVGQSATALSKGPHTSNNDIEKVSALFSAIGTVSVVDEEQLHQITALSGSGPAFIYYMAEAFEEIASEWGLDQSLVKELIKQTFTGAAEMMKQTTDSPEVLRKKVTSPGGTTEAGINTLSEHDFKQAIHQCIRSAAQRSQQLEQEITQIKN